MIGLPRYFMFSQLALALGRNRVVRQLLRTPIAAHVAGIAIALSTRRISPKRGIGSIKVLVFSAPRFAQDIEVLAGHPKLNLYAMPSRPLEIIQAIFSEPDIVPSKDYYLEQNPVLLALRERERAYIAIVARYLCLSGFDCAITPSIQYRIEQDWAAGFTARGLPFVGLHKEFTVLDNRQLAWRIDVHRGRKQKFLGSHLFLTNDVAKELFTRAEVFPEDRIEVIGLLRMDRLFNPHSPFRVRQTKRPQAVLFSFGHFSGGIGSADRRSHYFSRNDDFGFVRLFEDVHSAFVEAAVANPDAEFFIKPKNVEHWWIKELDDVALKAVGRSIGEIPNLSVTSKTAPELIRDARVVIGFNSTVLLESIALGRNTVLPLFAEAIDKYPDNVYLVSYQDMFAVAKSKSDLDVIIERGLAEVDAYLPPDKARMQEMMRRYLGFDDGASLERLVGLLSRIRDAKREMRGA